MARLALPGPATNHRAMAIRDQDNLNFSWALARLGGLYVAQAVPDRRCRRRRRKAAAAQCSSQLIMIHGVNLNKSPCSTRAAEQRRCGDLRLSLHWKGLLFIARHGASRLYRQRCRARPRGHGELLKLLRVN